MNFESVIAYFANQTPIFVISFMGLAVAALALGFGIFVTYFLMKRKD